MCACLLVDVQLSNCSTGTSHPLTVALHLQIGRRLKHIYPSSQHIWLLYLFYTIKGATTIVAKIRQFSLAGLYGQFHHVDEPLSILLSKLMWRISEFLWYCLRWRGFPWQRTCTAPLLCARPCPGFFQLGPIFIGSHNISSKNYAKLHIFHSGMRWFTGSMSFFSRRSGGF